MQSLYRVSIFCIGMLGLLAATAMPTMAQSGSYTQLQVLLPGETAAPGSGTGKLGTPIDQAVGVPFAITVRACDDQWNTVNTVTNIVRIESSDESATLPADASLVAGELQLTVTLNAAGSFSLTADDMSDLTIPQAVSAPVTVALLHGFVFSTINQKNQYAGEPMDISLMAVDPNGGLVAGYSGPVQLQQLTSYGIGRISPETVNLNQGMWSGQVTMYRADETSINRGNVNIYAFIAAQPEKNGTSDPFTVHPGPFARVQIVIPGQDPWPGSIEGIAGTPASQGADQDFLVDAFATDLYWNPLPSGDTVRITSSDPAASTPVTGALTNGYAQFSVSLGTVGTQTLSITDLTNGSIQGMTTAGIQVITGAVHHFEVDPLPPVITAGETVTVTIRATDSAGNTLPEYYGDAFLSANTGAGTITPEAITFTAGVWTGDMVFRGAGGAVSFACSDYSTPPHTGTSESLQVLPGPYTGLQVLLPGQSPAGGTANGFTGVPSSQNAGSAFTVQVRAVDSYFNRVSGVDSRLGLSSTDANLAAPPDLALTNGEVMVPVTLYRSGMQSFTAADLDSSGIDLATSSEVEVLAGPYARLLVLAPGEELSPGSEEGRSGAATDQSINFAFTVTVYATDTWFNPVGGVTDVVRLTSGDPLAELPPDSPLIDGMAHLTLRLSTGGFQQITVSNISQPTVPGSTTQVRAISSGLHLEAEVWPTVVQAGEPFTLTVRVTNDAGSVIQEINSFVDVAVQNASTQEPGQGTLLNTNFQLLQGQRSISETYTFVESIVLVVTDDAGNAPAVTDVIEVLPGQPANLILTSDPTWVRANKHATISARVVDAYDNGVPASPVDFTLVVGQGVLTPVDTDTKEDGVALADFLSPRVPEIDRIRARSGDLVAELDLETALVDPNAKGGSITNYPNPFHPDETQTTIAYVLDDNARVRMRIYTLSGGLVLDREFAAGDEGGQAGLNEVTWDGTNGDGERVASGGYVLYLEAEGNGATLHEMRRKIGVVW